jgi:hypothetical protein
MNGFISGPGMNEDFLSFVWRYHHFATHDLLTTDGDSLEIIRTGNRNLNAGPDFSDVRIRLADVQWIGTIEIHIYSSHWYQHNHPLDPAFESVILHVVWEDDHPVHRSDGTLLPTLVLKDRIDASVFHRYLLLMEQQDEIPCASQFGQVDSIKKLAMLDRVLLERLYEKAHSVEQIWENAGKDWEETTYQWLAQQFGFKLNAAPFLQLASNLPLKVLLKHQNNRLQLEALFFGTAGLLPYESNDEYVNLLIKEYFFLAAKYRLTQKKMQAHEWKFLRLRPAGFPTVRLAQFASLIHTNGRTFSILTNPENDLDQLRRLFRNPQSHYWLNHYQFEKNAKKVPVMGADSIDLLIINGVIPILTAYSKQRNLPNLMDKAIELLESLPAEDNRIIREWKTLNMPHKSAADTQGLLQWQHAYCSHKRCLDCTIGLELVRKN